MFFVIKTRLIILHVQQDLQIKQPHRLLVRALKNEPLELNMPLYKSLLKHVVVVKVWLGLDIQSTWLWLGLDHGLAVWVGFGRIDLDNEL